MLDLKIKKCVTYTYETTDGREFEDKDEAMEWQRHLCNIDDVQMLDSNYKPTKDSELAVYVYAKTVEQANSFNAIQKYLEYGATLPSAGFFRYDEISDGYIDVEIEIEKLQHILDKLKGESNGN